MWSGFYFRTRRHMWIEFVGSLLCYERFFPWYSGFPLSSKTSIWFDLWILIDLSNVDLISSRIVKRIWSYSYANLRYRNIKHYYYYQYYEFLEISGRERTCFSPVSLHTLVPAPCTIITICVFSLLLVLFCKCVNINNNYVLNWQPDTLRSKNKKVTWINTNEQIENPNWLPRQASNLGY